MYYVFDKSANVLTVEPVEWVRINLNRFVFHVNHGYTKRS